LTSHSWARPWTYGGVLGEQILQWWVTEKIVNINQAVQSSNFLRKFPVTIKHNPKEDQPTLRRCNTWTNAP